MRTPILPLATDFGDRSDCLSAVRREEKPPAFLNLLLENRGRDNRSHHDRRTFPYRRLWLRLKGFRHNRCGSDAGFFRRSVPQLTLIKVHPSTCLGRSLYSMTSCFPISKACRKERPEQLSRIMTKKMPGNRVSSERNRKRRFIREEILLMK